MAHLPPEILGHIFELAVPETSFLDFFERSAGLRALQLVCSTWRDEAERLLLVEPVIDTACFSVDYKAKVNNFNERQKSQAVTRHLRVLGQNPRWTTVSLNTMGNCLTQTMTKLSLASVKMDPSIFSNLPALRELSLWEITFRSETVSHPCPLLQLEDLSLNKIENELPSFLLPSELPSLRRLARDRRLGRMDDDGAGQPQYMFEQLIELRNRLDFISCDIDEVEDEDISLIGESLLIGIDDILDRALDDFDLELVSDSDAKSPYIKHIQITSADLGERGGKYCEPYEEGWRLKVLDDLLSDYLTHVQTFVVPGEWRTSTLYNGFKAMLDERKILLLHESESWTLEETFISPVFKEHRRREREGRVATE